MNDISIGIVTFKERKELIKELVRRIRLTVPETVDIILAINGNNEEEMPDDYRTEMLDLAKQYKNIYPIFCPEFKGLSKLWNNLVIFSKTKYNFILCDDITWANPNIYNEIINHINPTNFHNIVQVRHSYLDIKKLSSYGYKNKFNIDSVIHKLVDYYNNNI